MASYLQLNGTTDVVTVPSFAWDTIELDLIVNPLNNFTKIVGLSNGGYIQYQSGVNYGFDANFSAVAVNDVAVVTLTPFLTANVRARLKGTRTANTAAITYLFRAFSTTGYMRGNLYSAKFFLAGALQCHYDFTLGNALDQTGNSRNGTVTGTFISDGPATTPVSYLLDTKQQIVTNQTTSLNTKQQIVINRSQWLDTKQQFVVNRNQFLDTKQTITKNISALQDTVQQIAIKRSWVFDTLQEITTTDPETHKVSLLLDTKQQITRKITVLFPTKIQTYVFVKDTQREYHVIVRQADSRRLDWNNRSADSRRLDWDNRGR